MSYIFNSGRLLSVDPKGSNSLIDAMLCLMEVCGYAPIWHCGGLFADSIRSRMMELGILLNYEYTRLPMTNLSHIELSIIGSRKVNSGTDAYRITWDDREEELTISLFSGEVMICEGSRVLLKFAATESINVFNNGRTIEGRVDPVDREYFQACEQFGVLPNREYPHEYKKEPFPRLRAIGKALLSAEESFYYVLEQGMVLKKPLIIE